MTHGIDLQHSLDRIDTLPALPVIAQKLLTLALDTDEGEAQLLKLIAQDPQISAKIIGLSNSALFGSPRKITSISDAAMCLGLTQVKSVAVGIATMSAFARPSEGKFKSSDLWTHNMAIANAMRVVARHMPTRLRPLDDQIFLSGLLHDIGYNVLSFLDGNASDALYEKLNAGSQDSLVNIEQQLLGTHHGELGARLALHWGLPEEIIAVIRYHHMPDNVDAEAGQPLVSLIHLVEKILPDLGISEHTRNDIPPQEWMALGIDATERDVITQEVNAVAEQAKQLAIV
mgnify:CR=1 FL=1